MIIPAYNAAATIRETLDSVLAQTFPATEILVADDGSTDETPEILRSYGERVRVIRLPGTGGLPAVVRNTAAREASGNWLAFVDSDDLWEPEKLAAQIDRARRDPQATLIYTDRWNIGDLQRIPSRQSDSTTLYEGDVFEALLEGNFITTSSAMVTRANFLEAGGFGEDPGLHGVCEDWDLWLQLSAAGHTVALCPEPLTSYRIHTGTLTHGHRKMCEARLTVVRRGLATPRGRSLPRRIADNALGRAWSCSAWHIAPVDRWRALGWYARSSWHSPGILDNYKGAVKCLIGRVD